MGISPCELASFMDIKKVGHFEDLKFVSYSDLDRCNLNKSLKCIWYHWNVNTTRRSLLKSAPWQLFRCL